ncbi:MAG: glycosyltransferase family 2 protein [archaeon]|nr:glycosyltransferase family 2 protein [archaeon]
MNILNRLVTVKRKLDNTDRINLEILIINDGSSDNTKQILDENHEILNYNVITLDNNMGYGYVLRRGFRFAKENKYDWVISFDMDGQHEPRCLYNFTDKILDEKKLPQIISGTRYKDSKQFRQNPWKDRFLVNTVISGILNKIGFSITDSFCGLKAYRVNYINDLELLVDGYEMPVELWIKAKEKGFSIIETPVSVIYKDRDEALRSDIKKKDSFLFKKGEERIEKYIKLINSLLERPIKSDIEVFETIFSKYFNSVDHIDKSNFKEIQDAIFEEIKNLE